MATTSFTPGTNPHARTGALFAPLVVSRDAKQFAAWWDNTANQEEITELLSDITDDRDSEHNLSALMLAVFQGSPQNVPWLQVHGLARGVTPAWVVLDVDPSYDGEGVLSGVEVVLSLHVQLPGGQGLRWLSVSVYVDHPAAVFGSQAAEPATALAEVLDQAIALINNEIAERDQFNSSARSVISANAVDDAG